MNIKDHLFSALDWLTRTAGTQPESERRQANLLARILLYILLFIIVVLMTLLIFNPLHDPVYLQYVILIGSLLALILLAYGVNRSGHYKIAAGMLVACATAAPWLSMMIDRSIMEGDFVPLTYLTFSIMLSSILLPLYITIPLAALQIGGVTLVLLLSSATSTFNWFSFLAFILLSSVFSIISNRIIQNNMRQIDDQASLLALNEVRLQEESIRDYLTGLFNRRYLTETLEREIQRAARTQQTLGVIMLDVDHFTRINDSLGHAAGDIVLRVLARYLVGQVRQSDIACRFGGDEFVLIMPDASPKTTKDRADRVLNGVQALVMESENHIPIQITISLGVAVFPDNGGTGEAVLKSADKALYRAKRAGSNRVAAAD